MEVTLKIHGRDALAVWTLPFITSWHLSPDMLLERLNDSKSKFPVAFNLSRDGYPAYLVHSQWDELHNLVSKLDNDLTEQALASTEDRKRWLEESITLFWNYESCYVWQEEFQTWYDDKFIKNYWVHDEDEQTDLCYNPILPSKHAEYFNDVEFKENTAYKNAFSYGGEQTEIFREHGTAIKVQNWHHWLGLSSWLPEQSTCLLYGIDPDKLPNEKPIVDSIKNLHESLAKLYRLAKVQGEMSPYQWKLFWLERELYIPKPIMEIQNNLSQKPVTTETDSSVVDTEPQAEPIAIVGAGSQSETGVVDMIPANTAAVKVGAVIATQSNELKPWLNADPKDPQPEQPWYTPARYFARQLVIADSTLLTKPDILANKVVQSLTKAGIYKRGGKKPFDPVTIKKALSNISLG